jgi:hypothetical protein
LVLNCAQYGHRASSKNSTSTDSCTFQANMADDSCCPSHRGTKSCKLQSLVK